MASSGFCERPVSEEEKGEEEEDLEEWSRQASLSQPLFSLGQVGLHAHMHFNTLSTYVNNLCAT